MENSPRLRVLVVDDESLIRWSLTEELTDSGHQVDEAADGASALSLLCSGRPFDVVVLDYRLPDSNDLHLLETIRGLLPNSPVIMMTAFGSSETLEHALRLGAYRVVPKPFDVREMAKLVAEAAGPVRGI
jgi:DNA-binding NtrC family response regulator